MIVEPNPSQSFTLSAETTMQLEAITTAHEVLIRATQRLQDARNDERTAEIDYNQIKSEFQQYLFQLESRTISPKESVKIDFPAISDASRPRRKVRTPKLTARSKVPNSGHLSLDQVVKTVVEFEKPIYPAAVVKKLDANPNRIYKHLRNAMEKGLLFRYSNGTYAKSARPQDR